MLTALLSIGSTLCACVPMFVFLAVVWWMDRYDREPVWLLALTFLWGALGAVFGAVAISVLLEVTFGAAFTVIGLDAERGLGLLTPVVLAPMVEEPCKAAFLGFVIWNRHFDNMTDGFVYGAAAGLGFGMTENLLYFLAMTDDVVAWGSTVLIRTFYSAVMHATATALIGAALGWARFRGCLTLAAAGAGGLALGVGVHGVWNGLITMSEVTGGELPYLVDLALFPIEVLLVFIVFQICLWDESRTIRRELREEATNGHLPDNHPEILSSWVRRLYRSWVPRGVDHALYVQTATSLAMRKRQVREMGQGAPAFYRDEVERLRKKVRLLLAGARGA